MAVEYAGILAAVSLMAITLTGAYGKNVAAVFESSGVGITAVAKAAKAQKVAPAGAKAAYKRAPYVKPALKYLYALGWIGGTKNPGACGLTLLGDRRGERSGCARDALEHEARRAAQEARDQRLGGRERGHQGRRLRMRLSLAQDPATRPKRRAFRIARRSRKLRASRSVARSSRD